MKKEFISIQNLCICKKLFENLNKIAHVYNDFFFERHVYNDLTLSQAVEILNILWMNKMKVRLVIIKNIKKHNSYIFILPDWRSRCPMLSFFIENLVYILAHAYSALFDIDIELWSERKLDDEDRKWGLKRTITAWWLVNQQKKIIIFKQNINQCNLLIATLK